VRRLSEAKNQSKEIIGMEKFHQKKQWGISIQEPSKNFFTSHIDLCTLFSMTDKTIFAEKWNFQLTVSSGLFFKFVWGSQNCGAGILACAGQNGLRSKLLSEANRNVRFAEPSSSFVVASFLATGQERLRLTVCPTQIPYMELRNKSVVTYFAN